MSIAEWADLMDSTVTIETNPTLNDYGEKTYGTSTNYSAYIENKQLQIVRYDGETVVSQAFIVIAAAVHLDPTACRVTLPSGYKPSQPALLRCAVYADGDGDHHTELWF